MGIYTTNTVMLTESNLITWTPTIGDGNNNFTMSNAIGEYIIHGSLYFINIRATWTSKSLSLSSAAVQISLPFSTSADRCVYTVGNSNGVSSVGGSLFAISKSGQSYLNLANNNSLGSITTLLISSLGLNGEIAIAGFLR